MRDSQHYSKIALKYCKENDLTLITRGDFNVMEDLLELFGGNRSEIMEKATYNGELYMGDYITKKAQFVLNKLDRESQRPDAIFKKKYICYNGIINRPTRCFEIKEKNYEI